MDRPDAVLLKELREAISGEVLADETRRGIYATDASIYQQMPLAVAVPKSRDDVRAIVRIARERGVPVLARGGGTSLAGQTTGSGAIVVDFTKYLNRILEVNARERWVRVEPGVVRDNLNEALKSHGLLFAPETSTSNRAAVGGMFANNSSGMMSIRYGRTSEHVIEIEALLADGSVVHLGPSAQAPRSARERELREALLGIGRMNRTAIETRWPRVLRRVGGYSLDELIVPEPNFARFLCGSEGTLALALELKLNLVPLHKAQATMAVHYADFIESLRDVPAMIRHNPLLVELVDRACVEGARGHPGLHHLADFVEGDPAIILIVEATGDTQAEARASLDAIEREVRAAGRAYAIVHAEDEAARSRMYEMRKHGNGLVAKRVGDWKPVSFVEDACVPVEHMAEYFEKMLDIVREENFEYVVYGHPSVGVIHFKPVLNLKTREDLEKMDRVSSRVVPLVRQFGGCWSGEHGDGIIRGAKNLEFWGPDFISIFREVKRLFDPDSLLNPGKIFDTPRLTEHQRYGEAYRAAWDGRYFHFREEGGFQGAVEMCSGVGACRKVGQGTMCPSFQATRDEEASTRGRANALRLAMSGQLGAKPANGGPAEATDAMTSRELHEVLDLCLECKACAAECPNNVDMARMKSEFLAAYHERHGSTARDRLFAYSPATARLAAGPMARLLNPVLQFEPLKNLLAHAMGLAPERTLPPYATQTFEAWFARHQAKRNGRDSAKSAGKSSGNGGNGAKESLSTVAIFVDCYTNYYEPDIGRWMVLSLEHLGFRVEIAAAGCCSRPLISKGFLAEAKRTGGRTLRNLDPYAERGVPVVVLEPSCLSALRDDVPDLIDDAALGRRVARVLHPPDKLLESLLGKSNPALHFAAREARFLLHGHCHQKALDGTQATHHLMRAGGARIDEIPSGCCGMAGSFGYEAEHYELSQKIGEERLFPAVRKASPETVVVASGFSCRHQIEEATGRRPMHFAEAFGRALLGQLPYSAKDANRE